MPSDSVSPDRIEARDKTSAELDAIAADLRAKMAKWPDNSPLHRTAFQTLALIGKIQADINSQSNG